MSVNPNQIITPEILETLRTVQSEMMPELCQVVYPATPGSSNISASGAPTEDAQTAGETVVNSPCRISPVGRGRGVENATSAQLQSVGLFYVSLPYTVAVKPDCRIRFHGTEYEVVEVMTPRTYQTSTRCLCKKIN